MDNIINIILKFLVFVSLPWFWFYERFIYEEETEVDDDSNITLDIDGQKMIFQSIEELRKYIDKL